MRTICFTGRRPKDLCGYDATKYESAKKQLIDVLENLYTQGVREFISGGAQGFDQLAFWCVNELKNRHKDISNIVYVPFRGQERRWAAHGVFSIDEYNAMLNLADNVVIVTEPAPNDYQHIAKALTDRNTAMVNASDAVVALYPGDDFLTSKGGTAHAMRSAKAKGKPIIQLKYTLSGGFLDINNIVNV